MEFVHQKEGEGGEGPAHEIQAPSWIESQLILRFPHSLEGRTRNGTQIARLKIKGAGEKNKAERSA